MKRVFLAQSSKRRDSRTGELVDQFDTSSAHKFGELVELLPAGPVVTSTGPMIVTLRYKLRDYSDSDYILALGGPAEIGAAVAVAASMNMGRVKLLVWDRHERLYVVVPMSIHGHTFKEETEHA